MFKITVIKAELIRKAKSVYGEDVVEDLLLRIQKTKPESLILELEEGKYRDCLTYIFPDLISDR